MEDRIYQASTPYRSFVTEGSSKWSLHRVRIRRAMLYRKPWMIIDGYRLIRSRARYQHGFSSFILFPCFAFHRQIREGEFRFVARCQAEFQKKKSSTIAYDGEYVRQNHNKREFCPRVWCNEGCCFSAPHWQAYCPALALIIHGVNKLTVETIKPLSYYDSNIRLKFCRGICSHAISDKSVKSMVNV